MLSWLARVIFRRRRWVLAAAAAFAAIGIVWGGGVFSVLSPGGLTNPDMDSQRAFRLVEDQFGRIDGDLVILYSHTSLKVDDPVFARAVEESLRSIPARYVHSATTYWSTQSEEFVSTDRRSTYAVVQLTGDLPQRERAYRAIRDNPAPAPLSMSTGGTVAINVESTDRVQRDLARAEQISLPVLLVLLVLVFGSVRVALTPLALGVLAILGSFTVLRLLAFVTDVSSYAVNLVTMLGLGLSIDYALLITSRFREELRANDDVQEALVHAMVAAGRTVAFSGLTVAVSLLSLVWFPLPFLRSMAYGGIGLVLFGVVAALTVLPALLAVLGHRVAKRRFRPHRGGRDVDENRGAWHAIALSVMRRPLVFLGLTLVVLTVLALPFRQANFGTTDPRVLPEGTESRVVFEALRNDFVSGAAAPIQVVVSGADEGALSGYVDRLRTVPGATAASVTASNETTAVITVAHSFDPQSRQARGLVMRIREAPGPDGSTVLVGGQSAFVVDLLSTLGRTLPWAGAFVVAVSLLLLFWTFGSFLLPIKAVVVNLLSLTAALGAIVWIFQQGHLSSLLGFTATGQIDATQLILMLAIAFGLSMDYEVFLLSRIREQWNRTGDNATAVATGQQRTGWIITSAALLFLIVVGSFSTSGIAVIKLIGVGLVVALLVDATIVRCLLVPATMQILGRANWWAPAPLARIWERYGYPFERAVPPSDAAPEQIRKKEIIR